MLAGGPWIRKKNQSPENLGTHDPLAVGRFAWVAARRTNHFLVGCRLPAS